VPSRPEKERKRGMAQAMMMIAQLENIQQELNDFVERTREEMEQMVECVAQHIDIANRAVCLDSHVQAVQQKTWELSLALRQTRDKLLYIDAIAEKV